MLKIDLHIHTLHSGHAGGTIYEVMGEAARKKMKMIALTDHGPDAHGSAHESFFNMGKRAPKEYKGVKVLWGCEVNIVDGNGNIDLPEKTLEKIDIFLVGLHNACSYKDLGVEKNTEAVIKCFKKYKPNVFTHPTTIYYEYDIEKVCQAACDNNVLLELNISSLTRLEQKHPRESLENFKKMIKVVKKNKKKMIVGSDAHFLHEIGEEGLLEKYKKILGITDDMIINNFPDELMEFLKR